MADSSRAWVRPLSLPGPEYSSSEEIQFRRELEDYLLSVSAGIDSANNRLSKETSEATKRSLLTHLPTGQTEIGYEAPAYYCASKALESGATTVDTGGVTWAAQPDTWTEHLASDWEEDGTSGDFEYTGSSTRKFLVAWSMTLDYLTSGSVYAQRTSITGKIQKTPYGGAAADVAGSIRESGGMLQYAAAFGSYYFLNHLSGSVIVSMATGDKLSFLYGFANSYSVTASFTATLYGEGTAYHKGTVKGVTLNIVPAEFAE